MMKKIYETPEFELTKLIFANALLASGNVIVNETPDVDVDNGNGDDML